MMEHNQITKPVLGIIGAGKVGCTLGRLLHAAGYTIDAVYNRTQARADNLATRVDAKVVFAPKEVMLAADLTLLTVPDDAIQPIAEKMGGDWVGKAVVHTSGAHDTGVLTALCERGAMTGSLHPAFPFASVETAMDHLPGAAFALEATDEQLRGWLRQIVSTLKGQIIEIPPGGKAIYHASLVIASNYLVVLYAVAQELLMGLGAEKSVAAKALNGLVAGTVDNLFRQGIPDALTGPLVRADVSTIAAHLTGLQHNELLVTTYKQLARLAYPMLAARGVDAEPIEQLFGRGGRQCD